MSIFLSNIGKVALFAHKSSASLDTDGAHEVPPPLTQTTTDLAQTLSRGPAFKLSDLPAYIDAVKHLDSGIDDRLYLLEKILVLMSRLPDDSPFSATLQKHVVDLLYKDLPHPPSGYLSLPRTLSVESTLPTVCYAYRDPDGANYNPLFPSLGMARSPYARSVPSTNITPPAALPDPGLVFDTLLRREKFQAHPDGISSLFFAFANLVIHSLFHTDPVNWSINNTSSYLDLSPLYGNSKKQVDSIRRFDGTGKIWEDVFADSRLLFMPPSVCALLVILSRNHNFIAEKILDINERGTFKSPPSKDHKDQDEEIFQKARLVNSGFFMQIILGDYVGAILGLVRDGSYWRLDPLMTMRQSNHEFSPQGEGNVVSIEFNLLYRWHATTSEQDARWMAERFKKMFHGKDFNNLTVEDLKNTARTVLRPNSDVRTWTFDNLKRDANGRFNDDDLARILQNATEWHAATFGARGTPDVLRVIEILGIEQSRAWGACSLNEFRKFMGLKPYASFKEWNPRPEIHKAAHILYKDIDNLELYTGLQAEEIKIPMPGAGLCPGFTISRAILADAICLTRGDRFLTVENTPFYYTSWGYQDCQYDKEDGSYGGMLTKLLFRHLPNHYPAGSAYAHFPFLVPKPLEKHMKTVPNSPVDKYTWTRPPVATKLVVGKSYDAVSYVLSEKETFISNYQGRISKLTKGVLLDRQLVKNVLFSDAQLDSWAKSFSLNTRNLIHDKSVPHVGSSTAYVDIVKDVINLIPVYWVADEIVGLPLKKSTNPRGSYREQELYESFGHVAEYVFLNYTPVHDWHLREKSFEMASKVVSYVHGHLTNLTTGTLTVDGFSDSVIRWVAGNNEQSNKFMSELIRAKGKHTLQELAASVFAEVIPTLAHYSQAITHVVNFYLDDERREAREDLIRLSGMHSADAKDRIMAYVREALRLDPPVSLVHRTATAETILDGSNVKPGYQVIASIVDANLDHHTFGPHPDVAVYDRLNHAGLLGIGDYGLLSEKFFTTTVPQVLGLIFGLKNVRRAPGKSGELNRFTEILHGVKQQKYIDFHGHVTPWPASLVLEYTPEA